MVFYLFSPSFLDKLHNGAVVLQKVHACVQVVDVDHGAMFGYVHVSHLAAFHVIYINRCTRGETFYKDVLVVEAADEIYAYLVDVVVQGQLEHQLSHLAGDAGIVAPCEGYGVVVVAYGCYLLVHMHPIEADGVQVGSGKRE